MENSISSYINQSISNIHKTLSTSHIVNNILHNYTFQQLTKIKWNSQLNTINETLHRHKETLEMFPTSSISIGTGTLLAVVIIAIIIFIIYKKYYKLKTTFRGIQELYRKDTIPRDISIKELSQVSRTAREEPKMKRIRNNIRHSLRFKKRTKEVTCPTIYETIEEGESDYIPMTGSITSTTSNSPEEVTLRRKNYKEVRVLPGKPPNKEDEALPSSDSDIER